MPPPRGKLGAPVMAGVQARRAAALYGTHARQGSHLLPTPVVDTWRQPPRLPAWVVLDPYVALYPEKPPTGAGERWAVVECASRKAYGCGKHTQEMLDGLTLYQRLIEIKNDGHSIPHLSTALYIQASNDAVRGIKSEFRSKFAEDQGDLYQAEYEDLFAKGYIESTEENLIVLTVVLRLGGLRLVYYLIYDASDMSLVMVPCPPSPHPASDGTISPLPVRRGDGAYELLVVTHRRAPPPPPEEDPERYVCKYEDILCLWSPEAELAADPWRVLVGLHIPTFAGHFSSEVMFSFQGKAFFVDLSQGILCLDLPGAGDTSVGDFQFIGLPDSPHVPFDSRWDEPRPEDNGPRNINRTMRRVGDAVKFVCIDRSCGEVTVWTLVMPGDECSPGGEDLLVSCQEKSSEEPDWTGEDEINEEKEDKNKYLDMPGDKCSPSNEDPNSSQEKSKEKIIEDEEDKNKYPKWRMDKKFMYTDVWSLCNLASFALPRTDPRFPVLMPDGTLCLVLPYLRKEESDPRVDCICSLDLRGPECVIRLLWWSSLGNYRHTYPNFVRSDFFKRLNSPVNQQRGSIFF